MVTHSRPLDSVGEAFEMLETGEGGPGKFVIEV
jgi:hypothetical protein